MHICVFPLCDMVKKRRELYYRDQTQIRIKKVSVSSHLTPIVHFYVVEMIRTGMCSRTENNLTEMMVLRSSNRRFLSSFMSLELDAPESMTKSFSAMSRSFPNLRGEKTLHYNQFNKNKLSRSTQLISLAYLSNHFNQYDPISPTKMITYCPCSSHSLKLTVCIDLITCF